MLHLPAVLLAVSLTLVAGGPARPGVTPSTTHPSAPTPCVDGGGVLPVPTGEFRVGVSPLEAAESLGQIVAFYPAAACTGLHPPYLRPELVTALGLAPSTLDPIVVHAEAGAAPLAGSPRPVVLLAPGWTSLIALSTALATDLASHGYVVIAADPPLGAEATTFPDSDAAARRLEALSALLDLLDDPAIASITGPLDHSRVAAGGHSYAGSVAFQLAQDDSRLAAVFDLDGVLHGAALEAPMRVPALVVTAEGGSAGDPSLATVLGQSPAAVGIVLRRADHYDLTDVPALASQLSALTDSLAHGSIGPAAIAITNQLVRVFLECVLADTSPGERCQPTAKSIGAGLTDVAPWSTTIPAP